MDTTQTSTDDRTPESMESLGQMLRSVREAQGLSVADVAQRTKFSTHQVEALEADDSAHLPQGMYLRGFVRSYARVLELDENKALEYIPVRTDTAVAAAVARPESKVFTSRERSRSSTYLFAGALVIALLLGAFVLSHRDEPNQSATVVEDVHLPALGEASSSVPAASETPVQIAEQSVPAKVELPPEKNVQVKESKPHVAMTSEANTVESGDRDSVKTTVVRSVATRKIEAPVPVPVVAPAPIAKLVATKKVETPVPVPVVVPAPVAKPEVSLDALKKRPIHVMFSADSWMEIVDTNGEVLLSRTNPAGSEKWIGGGRRAPYEISIGKVRAVKIIYKGHEVDLSKFNPDQGAELVLE